MGISSTPNIAIYARVSTSGQNLDAQLDSLRAYALRRGGEITEFIDKAQSGRRSRRPALDRMMEAVTRREFDAVVITKLDRLARSMRHLCELADTFKAVDRVRRMRGRGRSLAQIAEVMDVSKSMAAKLAREAQR